MGTVFNNVSQVLQTTQSQPTLIGSLHVELFLMVVDQFSYKDIRNARLVSRTWQRTVNDTTPSRQERFLVPDDRVVGRPIYF